MIPPEGFHESKAKLVTLERGLWGTISHYTFTFLWYTIFPISAILVLLTPLALWLAHSVEAEDVVARGDGVTADREAARKAEQGRLAEGWFEAVDAETGNVYYFHRATRQVTWTRPVGGDGGGNHKKTDSDFDAVAFNDALHAVAREKARDR